MYNMTWIKSLPSGSDGKESTCNAEDAGEEDALEKEMITIPVFLSGKSQGQRSLASYSPQGHKGSNTTEHAHSQ